jgi:hypothetical protein
LPELERVDQLFARQRLRLVDTLDYALKYSEATAHLSCPPSTKAEFLYRVFMFSVIVDRFGIRLSTENSSTESLQVFRKTGCSPALMSDEPRS